MRHILCEKFPCLIPGTPRPQPQQSQQTFIPPAAPPPNNQQQRQMFSQLSPRQNDPYAQAPGTPRPVDPYAQPPGTPRPGTSADDSGFHMPQQPPPEVNRQLRDLLQRQQFKKLEQVHTISIIIRCQSFEFFAVFTIL
jgi:hypothetical protein